MSEVTTVQLTPEVRDRLKATKVGGETYSDTVDRLISTAVGYEKGEQVTVENVTNGRIRISSGDEWLDPGDQVTVWGQDPDVLAMRQMGKIRVVDR